jgi:hypothetical protein
VDGPDLTPATRKRTVPEPRLVAPVPPSEDGARLAALETAVRAVDVRLEYLERLVSTGFQEAASRTVVVAEATDEAIGRVEAAIAALPTPPEPPAPPDLPDTASIELKLDQMKQRLDDLAVAVVALQPTIDAILDLRSHVELVGGRLSDLLGGPSLTELMDRLDQIDQGLHRDER